MSASISPSPNGQRLRAPLPQLDPRGEPGALDARAAGREHLGALVDAGHRALRYGARQLDRDRGRAARDVGDAQRVRRYARDEKAPPARVLSERQHVRVAVVRRAERREELARVPVLAEASVKAPSLRSGRGAERRPRANRRRRGGVRRRRASASPGFSSPSRSASAASTSARTSPTRGHAWLAFDADGRGRHRPAGRARARPRSPALCEIAEESAGGGDLPELIARLAEIREREAPEGIEEAEEAANGARGDARAASRGSRRPEYLDRLGAASRRLEQALGDGAGSPFAAAMQQALPAVEELAAEIERTYKGPLA